MTPSEIIRIVDLMESENSEVQSQMDEDLDRYRLLPYVGDKSLNESRKFTSNDPKNIVNLAFHLISTATVRYQINRPRAQRQERGLDNMKELYVIGTMVQADERRARRLTPSVYDSMAMQCLVRGRRAHRVLLVREELEGPGPEATEIMAAFLELSSQVPNITPPELPPNTRTFPEIDDWDPRNVYYEVGRDGLLWACHKTKKSASSLKDEYDLSDDDLPDRGLNNDDPEYWVYDYLDTEENQVILENGLLLKEPTIHGMTRVPVSIGIVGALPVFQAEGEDYTAEYGQSVFHANRAMFDQNNFMLSIMLELAARAINPPVVYESRDGSLALDNDPRISGAEVSLSTQNEERIVPIPSVEMTRETGVFLANVQQMVQRGAFSHLAHGEIGGAIPSGFAINQLRQGMEIPVMPTIKSMMVGLKDIGDLLADAYATGEFDTMTLSGKTQDPTRSYFSEEITAEMLNDAGNLEVLIEPTLPQDNAAKVQLARMVTDGAVPMVSMRFARENYLGLQDVEQIEREVYEQLADTASPVAMAMKLMNAAAEQGEYEKAELYWMEFQTQLYQKLLDLGMVQGALNQANSTGEAPLSGMDQGNGGGGSPSMSPDVLPSQAQGVPQVAPTPQQGPLVPPGTPRPGGQADPADFAALG